MSTTSRHPTRAPAARGDDQMSLRTVRTFFLATFAFSWSLGVLMVVFIDQVEAVFGPMGYTNPVFILVVWGPGIVGLALVAHHHGVQGVRRFLARLTLWRMSRTWWLVLVLGMPAVFYAGAAVNGTLDDGFPFDPWYGVLPALLPALLIGPVEELGWRGVALPLLQRRLAPLWAALVVGVVAAVWHTPAFLMSGTKQSAQMNGPAWPDAQPWDMYLFVAVAALVVLLDRRAMLTCGSGATEVLLDDSDKRGAPAR